MLRSYARSQLSGFRSPVYFCSFPATRHPGLPPAPRIDLPDSLFNDFHNLLGDRGHSAITRMMGHAGVLIGPLGAGVVLFVLR